MKQEIKAIDEAMTHKDREFLAQYGDSRQPEDGRRSFNVSRKRE